MPTPKGSLKFLALAGVVSLSCIALMAIIAFFAINALGLRPQPTPPPLIFPTRTSTPSGLSTVSPSTTQTPAISGQPTGKIAYVCQQFKLTDRDQICLTNADGTDQLRLTPTDNIRHFYPSISPDGQSVLFSSNLDGNFELYELSLTGQLTRFHQPGIAPEVSPDNRFIVFVQNDGKTDNLWLMERNGSTPRELIKGGWDPTWSPDSTRILFARYAPSGLPQLFTVATNGTDLRQITNLPALRGRSDWSADGQYIVTYSGKPWEREIFLMNADGTNPRAITPPGGNSQGPSFSPDGQWVAFTAYFNNPRQIHGCEIYIMRIDGSHLTRLTNNAYCDWQPRWGP